MKIKNTEIINRIIIGCLIVLMCVIIFIFQTKKNGFHEDEGYTLSSAVNDKNGLMCTTDDTGNPMWLSKQYVTEYVTLDFEHYFDIASVFQNQALDSHPPFFYLLVHFTTILFKGGFTKYSVFIVNIVAFCMSLIIFCKTLKLLNKEKLIYGALIFFGLSMGTISMVILERMYMLLTLFILWYFYLNIKIYKNNFELNKKDLIELGAITVLGFLTQYFFAFYAIFIFILMIIKMIRIKIDKKKIFKYTIAHILYAIIGIAIFPFSIKHMLFSERGLKNLGNSEFFLHCWEYIKHLSYAFSINKNAPILIGIVLSLFIILLVYFIIKNENKFISAILVIPSVLYFIIAVKLTSFRELRYVMPMIPFIVLIFVFSIDRLMNFKYKNIVITIILTLLTLEGFVFSRPLFLYEDYSKCIDIANKYSDMSFVYVYDNFFNHMQSIPEMMIYNKTLVINVNDDDLEYLYQEDTLNNENSYILAIKSYMDNEPIIEGIKSNTNFKNIEKIYQSLNDKYEVDNNLYLVTK